MTYDEAVTELYQAPHEAFVAERKRLAAELTAEGDKESAARLAKLGRPSISAWAVNQLYWRERETFDELLASAERLRAGDLGATSGHREALAKLKNRAASLLGDAGHAASEATLRRVTTTLSSLAAAGSFEPDPPGALVADREALGFGAVAETAAFSGRPVEEQRTADLERKERERKEKEQREQQRAERRRLETKLREARDEVEARTRDIARLKKELAGAEEELERAQSLVAELEARIAALES